MNRKLFAMASCMALAVTATGRADTINFGSVFKATGPGSLDLTGSIRAVNLGNIVQFGPLTANETVNGVVFRRQDQAQAVDGIVVAPNPSGIAGQAPPNLGSSADENALERIFNFGEFNEYDVNVPVIPGEQYKVQVMMFEFISLYRTFDILVDGALGADELSVIQNDGNHQDAMSGVSATSFTVYEATRTATSGTMTIGFRNGTIGALHPLASQDPVNFPGATINDATPFVQAITIEHVQVPEPTAICLALLGLGATAVRRRMS